MDSDEEPHDLPSQQLRASSDSSTQFCPYPAHLQFIGSGNTVPRPPRFSSDLGTSPETPIHAARLTTPYQPLGNLHLTPGSGSFTYGTLAVASPLSTIPYNSARLVQTIPTITAPPPRISPWEDAEDRFASGIFNDIRVPADMSLRHAHLWYRHVQVEDRILVVLRAMQRAGFNSIGAFLKVYFEDEPRVHQTVIQSVGAFLQQQNRDISERPINIIRMIYDHRQSQIHVNNRPQPMDMFFLPKYAVPPSRQLEAPITYSADDLRLISTRNHMKAWAVSEVLAMVDHEADDLLDRRHGLMLPRKEHLTWRHLLDFDLKSVQEVIAFNAPVLYSTLATMSIGQSARKRLHQVDGRANENLANVDVNEDSASTPAPQSHSAAQRDRADRSPWLAVTVLILAGLFCRNQRANIFATIIGIVLFSCNAHRDIYKLLGQTGLSIGYSTVLAKLEDLADDAKAKISQLGDAVEAGSQHCLMVFDNVNKARQAWRQVLGNENKLRSGTAAVLVTMVDVPHGALDMAPVRQAIESRKHSDLCVSELLSDIDWEHVRSVAIGTVLRVWAKHIPSLSKFRPQIEALFSGPLCVHALPLRKTSYQTLRTMDLNEAKTTGTADVLRNIMNQLRITAAWLCMQLLLVCGDQLSIDRVRKAKRYLAKTANPAVGLQWALPVIQLFHMKWALLKCIFKLHWWRGDISSGTFGLQHDASLLGRDKFNPDRCDFYDGHHIVEDIFEALCLDVLRILCSETRSGCRQYPPTMHIIPLLNSYFAKDGVLEKITFDELSQLAKKTYERYLTTAAYEDAIGLTERSNSMGDDEVVDIEIPVVEPPNTRVEHTGRISTGRRTRRGAQPTIPGNDAQFRGDRCLANTVLFMRLSFWYLEISSGIAEGDIGRVLEILKILRFSFWGAGATNYGNELLELACNFLREYPPDLITTLKNNWLVNTAGLPGHWHELDLLMEHLVYLIKRLYNSKNHGFDSKFLAEKISLNIAGFRQVRSNIRSWFGLKKNSGRHAAVSAEDDINKLGAHYRKESVLTFQAGREQAYSVPDEFAAGIEKLLGGGLDTFLQRTMLDIEVSGEDNKDSEVDELELEEQSYTAEGLYEPPSVLSVHEGKMFLEPFVGAACGSAD
ncbi:hypothetical protein PUNSTDRAFT_64567 [Punctularia strigosozonata HHB-11173 SS5]|uniref:uncharacterized protein n=1 Tax=Punctularia strigosozonata (strain HHB-11173) TaxID=741275 RepID=UPI0004417AB1|nr:uncharacterized protein PUNSTDRAFT_64567 [Punctularia strigosozonata HHB-11173 SS5]EIN10569.1 hypothetical protein PUNSTDRAFT_64567 [Punctularia strigosozonata HHB-11173 SS5]